MCYKVSERLLFVGYFSDYHNTEYYPYMNMAYRNSWTLDTRVGCWTLDAGLWTLDSGRWILDAGRWILDSGLWTLDAGLWTLDSGRCTLDAEL